MLTIQWRAVVNALTKPLSYRILFVPRNTAGYDEMATDISLTHPNYNADLIRSLAPLIFDWILQRMSNGDQVTLKDAFRFCPTFTGRLNSPDDPLPDNDDLLGVNVYPSRSLLQRLRTAARFTRLPMVQKQPLITLADDTKTKLADVLNPKGVLRLTGSNLDFDEDDPDCCCTITGTESGATKQSTFAMISNTEILLVPDILAQTNPWNNEYTVTVTTQYTEHGTERSGTYQRRLRTPLVVPGLGHSNPPATGILTDNAATPYVSIIGGSLNANERLRIQAVLSPSADQVFFSLLDMKEGGATGAETAVTRNGNYAVQGFSGSAVSSLDITVNDYDVLKAMIRDHYSGRLVDILDVAVG
ncbi:DUF4469 domain-containing protein [Candidatus Electrothrix sp.]|uniref:DUF4469 domain-containing protein n=1 Tax=Candidatus Electrothrix sp. TaxID=2170559 RepID=UPI0040574D82